MVNIYTESEIKTILACPKLYSLGGSIENYTQSQKFLITLLDMFTLGLVKESFSDIDTLTDSCVKRAFNKHYKASEHELPTITRLKKYGYSFINNYLQLFNNKDYQILLTKNVFYLEYPPVTIRLKTNAVYRQSDRKAFLHAVCFVPFIDTHLISNDFFINLKAYFYKKYATTAKRFSDHSEVTIHLISVPSFNKYRSMTTDFAFYHKTIPIKQLDEVDPTPYTAKLDQMVDNPLPIPVCQNRQCEKRKECLNV